MPNFKNFSQFINEQSNPSSDLLQDKLLSIGGSVVKLGLDTSEEITRLLNDGQLFSNKIKLVKGVLNQCHRNIADKYSSNRTSFKIVSGYALLDNRWISHSWGLVGDFLIETTLKFELYYGYILTPSESEDFCFDNY